MVCLWHGLRETSVRVIVWNMGMVRLVEIIASATRIEKAAELNSPLCSRIDAAIPSERSASCLRSE